MIMAYQSRNVLSFVIKSEHTATSGRWGDRHLEVSFEPEPVVLGLLQGGESGLVEVLQQLHVLRGGDEVQNRVDRLLRVVARHCCLNNTHQLYTVLWLRERPWAENFGKHKQ